MKINSRLTRLGMRAFGWTIEGDLPATDRYVAIAAPHTSNWDMPFMLGYSITMGMKMRWMAKHTIFNSPAGWFFKRLGGLPVDRRGKHNVVEQMVARFAQNGGDEPFILAIPAEGTRGRKEYWKSGFYHIALKADVPVVLSYLDYGSKRVGLGPAVVLTGDVTADMDVIRAFYADKVGKNHEGFTPPRLREEDEGAVAVSAAG